MSSPLMLLRHLDSGRLYWAGQDGGTPVTDESMTSAPANTEPALLAGPVLVTIFVNGAPSSTRFVDASPPEPDPLRLYLPAVSRLP